MAERDHLTETSYQPGYQPAGAPGAAGTAHGQTDGHERSAEEIRQDIAARRELITETVDQISDRFQRTFDWRAYVKDYPLVTLGVAAGAGLLLGSLFKPRLSPAERVKEALAGSVEDLTDRFRHQLDDAFGRKPALNRGFKAAAAGVITRAVTDYLRNRMSVYQDQYSEAQFDEFDFSRRER
jgi:ElaB/YqjD/DUF883 family membrane-anchored ribosome-binding protein